LKVKSPDKSYKPGNFWLLQMDLQTDRSH